MFGLSFGELCVLLVVAIVVLGPKELPRYLRKAGHFAGRMRRLAYEMREKSGIDEVLRSEGIHHEIAEFRKLARGEFTGVVAAVRSATEPARLVEQSPSSVASFAYPIPEPVVEVTRERECPCEGPDAYGALPDGAVVYEGSLAVSPLAEDALYTRGEPATEQPILPGEESRPPASSMPA